MAGASSMVLSEVLEVREALLKTNESIHKSWLVHINL